MAQSLGFSLEQTRCVATLHHVFRRLEVDAFETIISHWAKESPDGARWPKGSFQPVLGHVYS